MEGPSDPRDFPGSGAVPTSPPPAFPVYGLDESWPGARWLDGFGYELGDLLRWVSLAHESADGDSLITVSTYARRTVDARAAQWERTPLQNVAFDAAHILINVTLPAQSVPRPDGFLPLLTERATKVAADHAQWPVIQWQVDSAAVAARVWRFADGWAAITDAVDDVYLSAVGVGAGPEDLALAQLQDASAYHFNLAQPLHPSVLSASRQAAGAQFEGQQWQRQDWHEDHVRLTEGKRNV